MSLSIDEKRALVDSNPLWYHTIDIEPGLTTPGWFDLRPIMDRIPWPDVRGKRCLDVGTYDGFIAFELERQGASEVVAVDVPTHEDWDWLPREREGGLAYLKATAGGKGRGFEIARDLLGSTVDRVMCGVYGLDPDVHGSFDVVVCGSLLLHLRDPMRALANIRAVTRDLFLSIEPVDLLATLMFRRRPMLRMISSDGQWFIPNAAGLKAMLHTAGFDVVEHSKLFSEPLGPAHPDRLTPPTFSARRSVKRRLTGGSGVECQAVLTRRAP